jgi:lipoprotein-anchoring transpeptidase ErfK/SrfK
MTKFETLHRTAVVFCFILALADIQPQPVWADTRQDTLMELSRLHDHSSARHTQEEARSVEATLAIADQYFQTGDIEQAERFYLLTIQKARILMSSTPESNTAGAPSPPEAVNGSGSAHQQTPIDAPVKIQTTTTPATEAPQEPAAVQDSTPAIPDTVAASPEPEYFSDEIISDKLVGTASTYTVIKSDTIRLVAAKLGVSRRHIIRQNNLDEKSYLKIGQKLVYNNRKIVPQRMKNGIVVNIPDRTLYYFKQGKLAIALPVALGVPVKSDKYDWKTPTGKFRITAKIKDPTWHVPPSIQSEMEDQGREIITSIPPGPENPLGKYAIKTSIPGILIHSTTKPWSIYSFASHGCIRVYPDQMEEFFKEVTVNTPGEIIYRPVKLAITEQGRVFLEVHQDVYGKSSGLGLEARRLIEKQNLSGQVNWQKVESIVQRKSGVAEDVTL